MTDRPHRTIASANNAAISRQEAASTKTGFDDKLIHGKGHLNANRKSKPIAFASVYKKAKVKPNSKSTPSAYLAALQKAKHTRRINKTHEQMSNDSSPISQQNSASCAAQHTSAEKIEQVYVNRKCIPTSLDQSEPSLHHSENKFCSLHGKQCQSVVRYTDNADASSSDSESSHGLIQKDDKTEAKPRRQHIIITDILQSEQLKTVHHIALVVFLYSVLWIPFYVVRLLLIFNPQITIYHYIYTSVHLLGYTTSGLCPWLFYFLHGYINSSTWSNMKYRILNPSNSDLSGASSI